MLTFTLTPESWTQSKQHWSSRKPYPEMRNEGRLRNEPNNPIVISLLIQKGSGEVRCEIWPVDA